MSTPMTPNAPDDFREQLSAWHDGALPDEASRFVMKRLLQDESLRAEVGRWQVVGDVLRREAQRLTAPELAVRVAAAIDEEQRRSVGAALGTAQGTVRVASRRRAAVGWTSAAAVGLAAVLMLARDEAPAEARGLLAAAPAPADRSAIVERPAEPGRIESTLPRVLASEPAASMAVARVPPLVRAPQPTPEQLAPLPVIEVDAPSRPWPRTAGGEAAFTVDYAVATGTRPEGR